VVTRRANGGHRGSRRSNAIDSGRSVYVVPRSRGPDKPSEDGTTYGSLVRSGRCVLKSITGAAGPPVVARSEPAEWGPGSEPRLLCRRNLRLGL